MSQQHHLEECRNPAHEGHKPSPCSLSYGRARAALTCAEIHSLLQKACFLPPSSSDCSVSYWEQSRLHFRSWDLPPQLPGTLGSVNSFRTCTGYCHASGFVLGARGTGKDALPTVPLYSYPTDTNLTRWTSSVLAFSTVPE